MGPEFFLVGKLFILITGASKGIGRGFAITFSQVADRGSHFLLIARNETGLRETASQMSNRVNVDYVSMDLSVAHADQLEDIIRNRINPNEYDHAIIIHNVGTSGDLSQLTNEMNNFRVWEEMYDLNVFSPAVLNSVSMKIFNNNVRAKKLVINLTSILSKMPLQSLGYYCSAKAAREMYFKVFAKEFPNVNVLNYSPYVVDTDLIRSIEKINRTTEAVEFTQKVRQDRKILTPIQAAKGLIRIIRGQRYKSGDFVDYYD
ncbi:GSCOCG00003198001-RA-CDS [Cotesia congregata]|uniref:Similar to spr: Sepiapterin reductase (Xenopus tropicalis) n=1 Tax=Cotesia congregata TaxID=51543 RepID=A0A8J2HQS5_COTCN|nr:GSCOCG00003198001-RA-CDS [Cotesia congregata]CAG5103243.1 Similar to spr: Sepiapterin reductase (Xenopus tropicalis) [Cotesia congregata]